MKTGTLGKGAKLWLVAILAATAFVAMNQRLKLAPRQIVNIEMQVALPLFVQVAMTGGDRFLAANISARQRFGSKFLVLELKLHLNGVLQGSLKRCETL